jgi:hypothetical protein
VVTFTSSACNRHRHALIDFVESREITPATTRALDHLDRCDTCRDELAGIAMALTGLRRIRDQIATAEPAPDAWARLHARIAAGNGPVWRWPATVRGLILSTMLVGLAVVSLSPETPIGLSDGVRSVDTRIEQAYFMGAHRRVATDLGADVVSVRFRRTYPDGHRPQWKEVSPYGGGGIRSSTAT